MSLIIVIFAAVYFALRN